MSLFTTSINVLFGFPFCLLPGSFNLSLLLPISLHCPCHSSLSIVPSHFWHLSIHAHLYLLTHKSFPSNSSWPSCINHSLSPHCPSCPAGHCTLFVWPLPPYIHPMASPTSSEMTSLCVYTPACPHFNIYLLSSQKIHQVFLCLACRSQQHSSFFSLYHFFCPLHLPHQSKYTS